MKEIAGTKCRESVNGFGQVASWDRLGLRLDLLTIKDIEVRRSLRVSWASRVHRLSRRLKGPASWTLAFILLGAGIAARILLQPWVEPLKFLTFFPSVAAATLLCGWRQATVVLILSALVAWYFFFPPFGSFSIESASTIVGVAGFLAVGGFLILVIAGMLELIDRLESSKKMQESLFRELQHRVANNLTIVVAILRNARRGLHDRETAAEALTDAEDRIAAMAQMHRRLYSETAVAEGLAPLLREVLQDAFRDLPVKTRLSIPKNVGLSIDQTTAIVLLVNEAAINAAKHVFRQRKGAFFEVDLAMQPNGRLQLTIHDDGPGMSWTSIADQDAETLGVGIMQAFARQLGGTLQILKVPGTTLRVEFAAH
jgi:two-component sensor histidine kinase